MCIRDRNISVDWNEFLEEGIICPQIFRIVEAVRDDSGVERIVRDLYR